MIPVNTSAAGVVGPPGGGGRGAGFTVLELLVVVGLVGVLSTLVLAAGRQARESGRISRASSELSALAAALESYRLAQGDYPRTDQAARMLQALVGRRGPAGETIAAGAIIEIGRFSTAAGEDPFLSDAAELLDPWGAAYHYAYRSQTPWSNPGYILYSAGPDSVAAAALLSGGFPDRAAAANADNLWSGPP